MAWRCRCSFQPARFGVVQSPYARLTVAVPYLATSSSSSLATDADVKADEVESEQIFIVRQVVESVNVPVSVKISPWHTAPANFLHQVEQAGAKGAVLFNRFYQPDFDLEELDVRPHLKLSDSSELLQRLRWLAIVSPRTRLSLAASGGVHTALDAIKSVMAGAHAVQVVSALLQRGPSYLRVLREETVAWMQRHDWSSLRAMRGNMSLMRCPDPAVYERANYMLILQGWRGREEILR